MPTTVGGGTLFAFFFKTENVANQTAAYAADDTDIHYAYGPDLEFTPGSARRRDLLMGMLLSGGYTHSTIRALGLY